MIDLFKCVGSSNIRSTLACGNKLNLDVYKLDVKPAYLGSNLKSKRHMEQSLGHEDRCPADFVAW